MPGSTTTPEESGANRSLLILNSGSSSLKFALFSCRTQPEAFVRGMLDAPNPATAVHRVSVRVAAYAATRPIAGVGHRVVHGGPALRDPQLVTDELIETLKRLVPFAPTHLPDEIDAIESARRIWPDTPHVLCFDTAFHAGLPDVARELAIPRAYAAEGVRRYGFHGLSYTFLTAELRRRVGPPKANGKVVLAHLGNGSSLAAVDGGRPVDTSMGFTPTGGVVMGTRSGDLDPGVLMFMARAKGLGVDALEEELSHQSGLLGLSGRSADMRDLLANEATDEGCRLAVDIYCYEIRKRIGAYAAALGGLDLLVFSGGIGEHAPAVRSRICSGLDFLGVDLDESRNRTNDAVISTAEARVAVHVIPSDEEVVIAQAAYDLLK